jgi:hypothetical protein
MSDEAHSNPESLEFDSLPDLESELEPDLESSHEPEIDPLTGNAIVAPVSPQINLAVLEGLSNQLVWKIGKEEVSERVVVRVGYASATSSFRELPKLRGATDAEVAEAAKVGDLVVEWIE